MCLGPSIDIPSRSLFTLWRYLELILEIPIGEGAAFIVWASFYIVEQSSLMHMVSDGRNDLGLDFDWEDFTAAEKGR